MLILVSWMLLKLLWINSKRCKISCCLFLYHSLCLEFKSLRTISSLEFNSSVPIHLYRNIMLWLLYSILFTPTFLAYLVYSLTFSIFYLSVGLGRYMWVTYTYVSSPLVTSWFPFFLFYCFYCKFVRLWNILPLQIRMSQSIKSFKCNQGNIYLFYLLILF